MTPTEYRRNPNWDLTTLQPPVQLEMPPLPQPDIIMLDDIAVMEKAITTSHRWMKSAICMKRSARHSGVILSVWCHRNFRTVMSAPPMTEHQINRNVLLSAIISGG